MTSPTVPPPTFATGFPFPGAPAPARKEDKAKDAPGAGQYRWRPTRRRYARLRRAQDALGQLPAPGEAVHFLVERFWDMADLAEAIIRARATPCEALTAATLSFSARNAKQLCSLIDAGLLRSLVLLSADYMAKANAKVYAQAVEELVTKRGMVLASARTHCKIDVLDWPGESLVIETSGNLSSCRTLEQVAVINDAGLAAFHKGWINKLVATGAQR